MRPGSRPKKGELPTKICVVCQRPFAWRKKWERCWDEVRYCSERCRRQGVSEAIESTGNVPPVETTENLPPIVGARGGGGRRRRSE